jgi:hypothetical protein
MKTMGKLIHLSPLTSHVTLTNNKSPLSVVDRLHEASPSTNRLPMLRMHRLLRYRPLGQAEKEDREETGCQGEASQGYQL